MVQTLLYGDARVVPFPNSSTIVELSYTFKAVTLLLGAPIPPGGITAPGGGNAAPPGGTAPGGGVIIPPTPPGGVVIIPPGVCARTKLPPSLSIPKVRSSVESIATLYRILLLNI
jgi:hypothetical protein